MSSPQRPREPEHEHRRHVGEVRLRAQRPGRQWAVEVRGCVRIAAVHDDLRCLLGDDRLGLGVHPGGRVPPPRHLERERQFRSALAEQFAGDYAALDSDSQDALSTLTLLDTQIRQAWPNVPAGQCPQW